MPLLFRGVRELVPSRAWQGWSRNYWAGFGHASRLLTCGALFGVSSLAATSARAEPQSKHDVESEASSSDLINWSGTHAVRNAPVMAPETRQELVELVARASKEKVNVRPIGSCLSPNGIGLNQAGMLSMALCDRVVQVDPAKEQVTVESGIRVSEVVEALRSYGLTLQNYASIAEQQIGGFIQVGAHGTGARIPPVDEQVTSMKLVTPARGEITLNSEENAELFSIAKVGLGCLGVVSEVTLQCVPMHKLKEHTFVVSREEVRSNHATWLRENRHLRYMWIPYTDSVVVVTCNPLGDDEEERLEAPSQAEISGEGDPRESTRHLLKKLSKFADDELEGLSFTQLRDRLLALNALDVAHVRMVNELEAEYWKASSGTRIDYSDRILGFDCGGQQWVSEVCFPIGSVDSGSLRDIDFMDDLLHLIEVEEKIASAAPLEQRWSGRSTSPMSVAYDESSAQVFCWVGIIMYLPTEEELGPGSGALDKVRNDISAAFQQYRSLWEARVWRKYWAAEHWAKLEPAGSATGRAEQREYLAKRITGLERLGEWARVLDPDGILGNEQMVGLGVGGEHRRE